MQFCPPPPKKNKNTATEEEKLEEVEDTGRDAKSQHTVLAYSPRRKQQPYIYISLQLWLYQVFGGLIFALKPRIIPFPCMGISMNDKRKEPHPQTDPSRIEAVTCGF